MRCDVCGEWYPSKYYFKREARRGELICNNCPAPLPDKDETDQQMQAAHEPDSFWEEKFDSWRNMAEKIKWWTFASSLVLLITGLRRRADYPQDTNPFMWMLLLVSFLTTPVLSLLTLPKWQALLGFLVVVYVVLIGMAA